jgi:GNAT superfamily N-acetyltransferase
MEKCSFNPYDSKFKKTYQREKTNLRKTLIREYDERDKEQVISLVRSTIEKTFKAPAQNLGDLIEIKKNYADGKFFVVEENGTIIGTVGVEVSKKGVRIRRLFVIEGMRKSGIGSQLLAKALGFCKKKGYKKVETSTYSQMGAFEFYKKAGFVKTKRKGNRISLTKTIF